MEKYLEEQYGVIFDENYLKSESDIKDYFDDCGREFLDCGQGYYQKKATVIVMIGEKFFEVTFEAEIESQKQDYGDRLYWPGNIKSVEYKEIEKPLPKEKTMVTYYLTEDQKKSVEKFMKENKINYSEE